MAPSLKITMKHNSGMWLNKSIIMKLNVIAFKIWGRPKSWRPLKKVAKFEIYVIFEVFALFGRRTKDKIKDRW